MKSIILYGSRYGSARRYAQELSSKTGIPAVGYRDIPSLSGHQTIVYIGALYAGGVLGLARTLRSLSLRDGQRLVIVSLRSGWLIRIYRKIGRISGTPCKSRFPPSYMAEQRFSICEAPLIIRRYLWDTEP